MANRNDSRRDSRKDRKKDDIEDQLVAINRITKVVKGGRRMRFAAVLVLVRLKKSQKLSARLLKLVKRE